MAVVCWWVLWPMNGFPVVSIFLELIVIGIAVGVHLQPGYWIAEKVVAFRYLNGGTLDPKEQAQWKQVEGRMDSDPSPDAPANTNDGSNTGSARWSKARAAHPDDLRDTSAAQNQNGRP